MRFARGAPASLSQGESAGREGGGGASEEVQLYRDSMIFLRAQLYAAAIWQHRRGPITVEQSVACRMGEAVPTLLTMTQLWWVSGLADAPPERETMHSPRESTDVHC